VKFWQKNIFCSFFSEKTVNTTIIFYWNNFVTFLQYALTHNNPKILYQSQFLSLTNSLSIVPFSALLAWEERSINWSLHVKSSSTFWNYTDLNAGAEPYSPWLSFFFKNILPFLWFFQEIYLKYVIVMNLCPNILPIPIIFYGTVPA
jgi:hypothetical protein